MAFPKGHHHGASPTSGGEVVQHLDNRNRILITLLCIMYPRMCTPRVYNLYYAIYCVTYQIFYKLYLKSYCFVLIFININTSPASSQLVSFKRCCRSWDFHPSTSALIIRHSCFTSDGLLAIYILTPYSSGADLHLRVTNYSGPSSGSVGRTH